MAPRFDFPLVEYSCVRDSLHTGDVVTFDSDELLGIAIRHFAGAGTHTAMVARFQDVPGRIFLLQALAPGIVPVLMSHQISGYDGRVYVSRAPSNAVQQLNMLEIGMNMVGNQVRYDYWALLMNALHRVPMKLDHHSYCTEFVQYVHDQVGVLQPQITAMIPGEYLTLGWPTMQLAAYSSEGG